jgi:putative FmdB family regulatory protein
VPWLGSKQIGFPTAREIHGRAVFPGPVLSEAGACACGETCYQSRPKAMPNYDYECRKCGKRFEVFQSMNDPKLTDCPAETCDGEVKRLLGTGGGIIFKGSGFYQTDYRSSSYQAGAKADSGSGKTEAPAAAAPAAPAPKSAE